MVYVTNRTYHNQFRLTPSPSVNLIVRGCLLKASLRTGVPLVVVMTMGNHFELIVDSPMARLDDLMEYFQKEVSHRLNRMRGVEHTNFPRRYHASELGSRADCERKIAEILCNPVRAGLVYNVDDWPGFSTLAAHRSGESMLVSRHVTRPEAGALNERRRLPNWVDTCPMIVARLHRPRFAATMSEDAWHARVVALVEAEEARLQAEFDRANARTVGRSRILDEQWYQRPKHVTWKSYRRCISADETMADAYDAYYEETERAYKKAARAWRHHGQWAEYPPGTFPPGWLRCVRPSADVGPPLEWMTPTGSDQSGDDPPPPTL